MSQEKFYLAFINEHDVFDPAVHNREDELVYSFDLSQVEGDFALLSCIIKNPRIGLLNASRKQWVFFSFDDGSGTPEVWFKGRLTAIPTNIFDTLVTLNFIAKPSNYDAQKIALANTLKVLPYYDPIFISPDSWNDPDTVLEAYSALWHTDPVTHVVTLSNTLVPEDGVVEVLETEHFYDGMQVTLNQTPLRQVTMTATIPWTQSDEEGRVVDLTNRIKRAFGDDINGVIRSYTMEGLISNWPKQGDSFSNGWTVTEGTVVDISYTQPIVPIPDVFSWQGTIPRLADGSIIFPLKVTGEYHSGDTAGFNFQFELVVVQLGYGSPTLKVTYGASREFGQIVTFTMRTAQQAIITDPGADEVLAISLNANKVSDYTANGTLPIGDVRKRDYVHSPRGLLSCEYLLLVARAHLISRSRAVETTYQQAFKQGAVSRSLRKGALLHDHRLPGGGASGKIIKYHFTLDGSTGAAIAEITFGSAIGYGGSYSVAPGDPSWVDDGYVDREWQEYINEIKLTDTQDVQWTIAPSGIFDDGLDFIAGLNAENVTKVCTIENTYQEQAVVINAAGDGENTDQAKISTVLQNNPTKITMQLVPMEGGPFQQEVVLSLSDLIVPKQIDLEAPSNA